jgi:hypothetical protein
VLRRISKWLVVAALCFTLGLHWAVLQGVAWTTMFVGYAQEGSLSTAFEKTFSGKAPCKLCKFVAEGKSSEKKQEILKADTKFDFLCGGQRVWLNPPVVAALPERPAVAPVSFLYVPPSPPPRCA